MKRILALFLLASMLLMAACESTPEIPSGDPLESTEEASSEAPSGEI